MKMMEALIVSQLQEATAQEDNLDGEAEFMPWEITLNTFNIVFQSFR